MFTKLATFAAAALIVAAIADPAHASLMQNGTGLNGIMENGLTLNGTGWVNGLSLNGQVANGQVANGTASQSGSFAIDGIALPADAR